MWPTLKVLDSSLGLLREGYAFIPRRCEALGTDGFRTRLLLKPVTCIHGADAVRMFYSGQRFTRQGAFPNSVMHLLQDEGSVQSLDGDAHRHRKAMFLQTLQGDDPMDLHGVFEREWHAALPRWQRKGRIVLHQEMEEVLTRTSAAWAGVPMSERDVSLRTGELSAMVDNAGRFGPANWWARARRIRCERWAQQIVVRARSGDLQPPDGSFLAVLASHREPDGQPLSVETAGVELLNVLRPMVAVSRFIAFAALALLRHPEWHETFATGNDDDLGGFVNEVRRLYPFFPLVGGRARRPFTWQGHDFAEGEWTLLDLYGTNHDPRSWEHARGIQARALPGVVRRPQHARSPRSRRVRGRSPLPGRTDHCSAHEPGRPPSHPQHELPGRGSGLQRQHALHAVAPQRRIRHPRRAAPAARCGSR